MMAKMAVKWLIFNFEDAVIYKDNETIAAKQTDFRMVDVD